MSGPERITLAVTGASGMPYALRLLDCLVREDAQLLYGFIGKRDRDFFRELIRLNGVGPKLALALMSSLEVDELVRAVSAQDTAR